MKNASITGYQLQRTSDLVRLITYYKLILIHIVSEIGVHGLLYILTDSV